MNPVRSGTYVNAIALSCAQYHVLYHYLPEPSVRYELICDGVIPVDDDIEEEETGGPKKR